MHIISSFWISISLFCKIKLFGKNFLVHCHSIAPSFLFRLCNPTYSDHPISESRSHSQPQRMGAGMPDTEHYTLPSVKEAIIIIKWARRRWATWWNVQQVPHSVSADCLLVMLQRFVHLVEQLDQTKGPKP